jgi:hypothetical protein
MSEENEQRENERIAKLRADRLFQLKATYGDVLGEKLHRKELAESKTKISDEQIEKVKWQALGILKEIEEEQDITDREYELVMLKKKEFEEKLARAEKQLETEQNRINEQLQTYRDVLNVVALVNGELAKQKDTSAITLRFERKKENAWSLVDVVREPLVDLAKAKREFEASQKAREKMIHEEKERKSKVAEDMLAFEDKLRKQDKFLQSLRNEKKRR